MPFGPNEAMEGCSVKLEGGKWLWWLRCKNLTRSDVMNVFRSLTVICPVILEKKLSHVGMSERQYAFQNAFGLCGYSFLLVLNVCLQSSSSEKTIIIQQLH